MISCSNYDYIEIVCLYRYPVRLQLQSGEVFEGTALDTARNQERQECIKIQVNESEQLVQLDTIAYLEVTAENPHIQGKVSIA
jgi:Rho-binding antiterminator